MSEPTGPDRPTDAPGCSFCTTGDCGCPRLKEALVRAAAQAGPAPADPLREAAVDLLCKFERGAFSIPTVQSDDVIRRLRAALAVGAPAAPAPDPPNIPPLQRDHQAEIQRLRVALERLTSCENMAPYEPGYITHEFAARVEFARRVLAPQTEGVADAEAEEAMRATEHIHIAPERLAAIKERVLGAAPGRAPAPEPRDVAEACALVCESRSRSLFHDSGKVAESNEAGKCATAIRSGWTRHLAKTSGVTPPAPSLTPAEQAQLDAHWPWTGSKGPGMDWANANDVIALLKSRLGITGTAGQQPIERPGG